MHIDFDSAWVWVALTMLTALVTYFPFLTSTWIHVDDEVGAYFRNTVTQNISLGRWATSLVRVTLLPERFNEPFSALAGLLAYVATILLFTSAMFRQPAERIAAAIAMASFPQMAYQMEFHVQQDVVPIGCLSSVVAYVLYRRSSKTDAIGCIRLCLSSILLAFSMGVYQPIALFFCVLALGDLISDLDVHRAGTGRALVRFGSAMVLVAASAVLYVIICHVSLNIAHIQAATDYFSSQIAWGRQPAWTTVKSVVHIMIGSIFGQEGYYGQPIYALALAAFVAILISRFYAHRHQGRRTSGILVILASLALLLCPYATVMALGSPQAARTFVVQGACLGGMVGLAIRELCCFQRARIVSAIALGALVAAGSYHVSRLVFADVIQYQSDVAFANRLVASINMRLPDLDKDRDVVFLYGPRQYTNPWRQPGFDAFGISVFDWDNGNTYRDVAFMVVSGVAELRPIPDALHAKAIAVAKTLPVWPRPGSVSRVGDMVVIRLAENGAP